MIKCPLDVRMSFARNTQAAMRWAAGPTISSRFSFPSVPTFTGSEMGIIGDDSLSTKKIIMGIIAIIVVILLVLIVIHYTVTPIFKIKKDGTGIIPVPGMTADDGVIYWQNSPSHNYLDDKETILEKATGYTVQMDLYFNDINQDKNSSKPRPIFLRYNPAGVLRNPVDFSLGIFMAPDINDIHVIVRTSKEDSQIIVVKNIPAKTVIRLGVIVGDNYFEAYRNGELVASRTFSNGIRAGAIGRIWGSPGSPIPDAVGDLIETKKTQAKKKDAARADGTGLKDMFKTATDEILQCNENSGTGLLGGLMNLHVWARTISPGEMKYATPSLPDKSAFVATKQTLLDKIISRFT